MKYTTDKGEIVDVFVISDVLKHKLADGSTELYVRDDPADVEGFHKFASAELAASEGDDRPIEAGDYFVEFADRIGIYSAAEISEWKRGVKQEAAEPPATPPPVDNDHVAEGCEKFSEPTGDDTGHDDLVDESEPETKPGF